MKKSTKILIFLSIVIFVFSVFLEMKIYAKANNEDNIISITTDGILDIGIGNKENEMPIIYSNNIGDTQAIVDTENQNTTNNAYKSVEYKASDGKSYEVIATLNIPSLGIEYPVLSTTSTESLKIALNKYWGPNPNEVGNMVIVGHNYKNKKFFSKLPNIQIGATVKITDTTGKTLEYKVYETDVIDPYDNSCTSQLTNGQTEITLITCYNNGKQRFIAKARAN